ncbi:MAG: DUF6615 family protein [Cyanobacteria bacterium P01_A01_bin.40]
MNINTFTRQEENKTTGADYELELWLIGRFFSFPLVIQAKKFIKNFDSYHAKLNYPDKTQNQLKTLLIYAQAKRRLPFYVFYSLPDINTQVICTLCTRGSEVKLQNTGVFMTDACTIKDFADKKPGTRISKNQLLKESNLFHCIFCCPMSSNGKYFQRYFRNLSDSLSFPQDIPLPNYVDLLLTNQISEINSDELTTVINQNELRTYRHVAVYEMRNID